MGVEIERKFLVRRERLPSLTGGVPVKQGYIPTENLTTVRIRVKGAEGFLTVKGPAGIDGTTRPEFEYGIPLADAERMLASFCGGRTVEKTRYEIPLGGHVWELDLFSGANEGLMMAEIELSDPDEEFVRPDWLDREVTGNLRYCNSRLLENPWPTWAEEGD